MLNVWEVSSGNESKQRTLYYVQNGRSNDNEKLF